MSSEFQEYPLVSLNVEKEECYISKESRFTINAQVAITDLPLIDFVA